MQTQESAVGIFEDGAVPTRALSILVMDSASPEPPPVLEALDRQGFQHKVVTSPEEATMRLDAVNPDAIIIYERALADLDDFVDSVRKKLPRLAMIVVQTQYDGPQECRLFDLGVDDVVNLDYSPSLLATRAVLRTRNRKEMMFS